MREQLITFETSKLAKEKGFEDITDCTPFECVDTLKYPKGEVFVKPTQSLLQKWLREEHDLDVNVMCLRYKRYFYKIFKHDVMLIQLNDVVISYPTYEEALEEGLQEALKLIKLKEDGKEVD